MSTINAALRADAARIAYQSSLTLAKAAWHAARHMQWRNAARLFDQAADTLEQDPHGSACTDEQVYRRRAAVCRTLIPTVLPARPLPDPIDAHRTSREEARA